MSIPPTARIAARSNVRCAALAAFALLAASAAHAQVQPSNPPASQPASGAPPRDVARLFDDLDDIDRLRALNPLKLTADQEDRLITAIKAAQAEYTRKVNALGSTLVLAMAADIKATKKQTLGGAPIPKDFDDRVKKAESQFLSGRSMLNMENWKSLIATAKSILTDTQVAQAVKFSKAASAAANKPAEGSDDQWLNFFVLHEFIDYPRIVPLLTEMRAAATAGAQPAVQTPAP